MGAMQPAPLEHRADKVARAHERKEEAEDAARAVRLVRVEAVVARAVRERRQHQEPDAQQGSVVRERDPLGHAPRHNADEAADHRDIHKVKALRRLARRSALLLATHASDACSLRGNKSNR